MKKKNANAGRYALRTVGILCFLYGIVPLLLGKSAGMAPVWLLLGVLCITVSFKKPYNAVFSRTWIKVVLSVCVSAVIIFIIVIAANGGRPASSASCDTVIVLGCQVNGVTPSRTLRYRLEAAYDYLTMNETATAVLSGGQVGNEEITEAEAMYRYLVSRGISEDRLIMEDRSTDTYENLMYSFALLSDAGDRDICVISSDFHLLRAKMLAEKLGKPVGTWGAPTYAPLLPNYYLREMLAIVGRQDICQMGHDGLLRKNAGKTLISQGYFVVQAGQNGLS